MKNTATNFKIIRGLIIASALALSGCGDDSASKHHVVTLTMGSYTTAGSKLLNLILPSAHASVSQLNFCFKRLRFKMADVDTAEPSSDEDNIDFDLGDVSVGDAGISLGTILLPEGNYKRVEFDLEDHCASGKSLEVTNSNGTYSTNARITIKFSGSFNADSDKTLELSVQNILDALNNYNGVGSLEATAEGVSGTL